VAPGRAATQAALPSEGIVRLRREKERLRMERGILKKSIAIFAGVPK
jgi:transposase